MDEILTAEQVAQILQVHPFTVLKFIKNGKLKASKLGRVYRIRKSDVDEFLDSQMQQPRSTPEMTKSKPSKSQTGKADKVKMPHGGGAQKPSQVEDTETNGQQDSEQGMTISVRKDEEEGNRTHRKGKDHYVLEFKL